VLKSIAILIPLLFATQAVAADFTWLNESAQSQKIEQLQGKPVVVHLWASWCPPCRDELKAFDEWRNQHPEIKVLMVSLDKRKQDAIDFMKKVEIQRPLLLTDEAQARKLGAQSLPTTIIVAADGSIFKIHRGPRAWDDSSFSAQLMASLNEAGSLKPSASAPSKNASESWLCKNTGMLCP
jgi:thiol-disulfide isomerase/thioredoxin